MNYINKGNKATKIGFGEGVLEAAKKNNNVVGLGADITASVGMNFFADAFPDRFFSLGIAEQNCIAVASGMALCNKVPVFSTYGVFAAHRACDQIRISLCYNNLHVVIGGAHAGVSVGPDGATHQALEDIATMRVLPRMTLISPCDATQTKVATEKAILEQKGPVYIRFGREPMPDFTSENQEFTIGKGQIMKDGSDICIIATGHEVWESMEAAKRLEAEGKSVMVVNIHTIKPLDEDLLLELAERFDTIYTVEEHQIIGGLGSAIAEFLSERKPIRIIRIGINDEFGESGKAEELMHHFKLDADGIYMKLKERQ